MTVAADSSGGATTTSGGVTATSGGDCVLNKDEVCKLKGIVVTVCRNGAEYDSATGSCQLPPGPTPPPGNPGKGNPGRGAPGRGPNNGRSALPPDSLKGDIEMDFECTSPAKRWKDVKCGIHTEPPNGVSLTGVAWSFSGRDWQRREVSASGSGTSWTFEGETTGTVTVTGSVGFVGEQPRPFQETLDIVVTRCNDQRDDLAKEYKDRGFGGMWSECTTFHHDTSGYGLIKQDSDTEHGKHSGYGYVDPRMASLISTTESHFAMTMLTTSGYRCPIANSGRSSGMRSNHVWGRAVDFVTTTRPWTDSLKTEIKEWGERRGLESIKYTRAIDGANHNHLAWRY